MTENSPIPSSTVYGYARVSHPNSFKKDSSIPAQAKRITEYYNRHLSHRGELVIMEEETAVSAYKVPFHARPVGSQLFERMGRGDALVVDRVDRLWRSMVDFGHLLSSLTERGVDIFFVHFLGDSFSTTTAAGKFMLNMLVAFSELESQLKSERIKEAFAARGFAKSPSRSLPYGIIYKDDDPDSEIVWDMTTYTEMGVARDTYIELGVKVPLSRWTRKMNKKWRNSTVGIPLLEMRRTLDRKAAEATGRKPYTTTQKLKWVGEYVRWRSAYDFLGFTPESTPAADVARVPKDLINEAYSQYILRIEEEIEWPINRNSVRARRRPKRTAAELIEEFWK